MKQDKFVALLTEIEDVVLSCKNLKQAKETVTDWMLDKRDDKDFVEFIQPLWLRAAYLLDNFWHLKK